MGFKTVSKCFVCGGYVESSFKKAKCIKCKTEEQEKNKCSK
jgi:hypothetical protein